MKKLISIFFISIAVACNNSGTKETGSEMNSSNVTSKTEKKSASGCSSYYWFKEGAIAEYSIKDANGKETSHSTSTVTNVRNEGGILLADFSTSVSKGHSITATYKCEGDKIYMDMKSFFANNFSALAEKGGMEIEVEDAYLSFPSTMKVGDDLEETNFKIVVKKDGKPFMTTTNKINNRKVEGTDQITTLAGTWDCLRISETSLLSSEMMGKQVSSRETKTVYWFAPGVGFIKTINSDKDGKVTMQTDLVSLKG